MPVYGVPRWPSRQIRPSRAQLARVDALEVPQTIAGLHMWFAADKITGLSNGAAVPQWDDASGFGNHAAQSTGTARPTYQTGVLNGLPVVRFDGTDDRLQISNTDALALTNNQDGVTMIAVANLTDATTTGNRYLVHFSTPATANTARLKYGQRFSTTNKWDISGRRLDADTQQDVLGGTTSTGVQLLSAVADYANSNATLYRNGSVDVVTTSWFVDGNTSATDSHALGVVLGGRFDGTEVWVGDIAEVLVYDSALSLTDLQTIEAYLTNKYALSGGTTPVTASVATSWGVRQEATKTVAQSWAVKAAVSKTVAQTWNVRAQVAQTVATAWSVKVTASQTVAQTWNVAAQVSKTVATTWNARAQVAKTLAQGWAVKTTVSQSVAIAWAVRAQVAQTIATTWAVRAAVSQTVAQTWNVAAQVNKTLATTWNTHSVPGDIADLALWFTASDLSGLSDGGAVSSWTSRQGTSTASQSTGGSQPTKQTVSGKACVRFDGTDDRLNLDGDALTATQNVGGFTLFIRVKLNNSPITGGIVAFSVGTSANLRTTFRRAASTFQAGGRRLDADAFATTGTQATDTTTVHTLTGIWDYTNSDLFAFVDGTAAGSNTTFLAAGSTSNTASQTARFGCQSDDVNFIGIDLYEVIAYKRALNSTERQTVESYLASGITSVTASVTNAWAVRAAISQTVAESWAVRAEVVKTVATTWGVGGKVTQTLATAWAVKTAVSQTVAQSWAVKAAISKTVAQSWVVRAEVSKTVATTWGVGGKVTQTLATAWVVKIAVSQSIAQSWAVKAAISKTVAQTWAVRAEATKTLATTWGVGGKVTSTVATTWNIRAAVSQTVAQNWAVKVAISKTVAQTWAVRAQATKTVATTWNTVGRITATLVQSWAVRVALSQAIAQSWAVRAVISKSVTQSWAVRAWITQTLVTGWLVDQQTSYTGAIWSAYPSAPTWDIEPDESLWGLQIGQNLWTVQPIKE